MAKPNGTTGDIPPVGIHFQAPLDLLVALDTVRSAIQSEAVGRQAISRADVVRLALRRLYLGYLVHFLEEHPGDPVALEAWAKVVREQQAEGTCPAWLFPGQAEPEPGSRPSKTSKTSKTSKKGE